MKAGNITVKSVKLLSNIDKFLFLSISLMIFVGLSSRVDWFILPGAFSIDSANVAN